MPYIKKKDREKFQPIIMAFQHAMRQTDGISEGELNYIITQLCIYYGRWGKKSYSRLNATLGVLDAVAREYYRREVTLYENEKCKLNGDCFCKS